MSARKARQDVHKQLTAELHAVCREASRRFATAASIRKRTWPTQAKLARSIQSDIEEVSELMALWQETPAYLHSSTEPLVIPLRGAAPSFEALCAVRGSTGDASRLLLLAKRLKMCRSKPGKRLQLISPVAVLNREPELLFARTVVTVERMLRTMVYNIRRSKENGALLERSTCDSIAPADSAIFNQMAAASLVNVIDQHHRWLIANRKDAKVRKKSRVGIATYVFRDEEEEGT